MFKEILNDLNFFRINFYYGKIISLGVRKNCEKQMIRGVPK